MMWLNAVVSIVVATLVSASVCTALRNVRRRRRVVNDSPSSSASPLKSTTHFLSTRGELAEFVSDLRNLASDSPLTMTIRRDSLGVYFVSCATNEFLEPVLRAYLLRPLRTSLTPLEWQFWESELQQAVREGNGSPDGSPLLVDDAKCLNCGMYFNSAQGYCDWCGLRDSVTI